MCRRALVIQGALVIGILIVLHVLELSRTLEDLVAVVEEVAIVIVLHLWCGKGNTAVLMYVLWWMRRRLEIH